MKQISNFKKSIPDGERFLQEPLSQCSYWKATAYIGGQNPLTWKGIYQERPISHWTGREIAEEVMARGIVPKISARHAARVFKKKISNRI